MKKQACEQLTLFPVDSPASLSLQQESEKALTMTVLLRNSSPLGLLAKMLLESSVWQSRIRILKWKVVNLPETQMRIITTRYCHDKKTCSSTRSSKTSKIPGTPSRHLLFQLAVSMPRTKEAELLLLPTPTATMADHGGPNQRDSSGRPGLQMAAQFWSTPNTMDYLPQRSPEALKRQAETSRKGRSRPCNLREQVNPETMMMWPTPSARAGTGASNTETREGAPDLQTVVTQSQEDEGQLNPDWVEWLMGVPVGWTALDTDVKRPEPPADGEFWPEEPGGVPRVANDIPNRVDRIKSLGNMVVPRQFYPIFKAIVEIERGAP